MKYLFLFLIGNLLLNSIIAQDSTYYWYGDQKIYLMHINDREFILLEEDLSETAIKDLLKDQCPVEVLRLVKESVIMNEVSSQPIQYYWAIVEKQKSDLINPDIIGEVFYNSPFFETKKGDRVGISHLFYVKLKKEKDYPILQKLATESNVEVVNHDKSLPLWYTLSCSKISKGNSLQMSNYFYETGLFAAAEPDFMAEQTLQNSPNDEFFGDQWGLYNFGQYGGTSGIDMNIFDAWDITEGDPNITVAVIDHGIDRDHPDLTSLSPYSYDTETQTSPNGIYGPHGMPVSGIICGDKDNNIGIAGIAPNTLLMAISNGMTDLQSTATLQQLADGFEYAVDNGAAVINCSWILPTNSVYINNAIDNAIDNGRGGLGCVVVFSTGNYDEDEVRYPANYTPEILAVGAINQCGKKTEKDYQSCDTEYMWGSNYGDDVDLVAPGVLMATIDREGSNNGYNSSMPLHIIYGGDILSGDYIKTEYTAMFNGTSCSAPHVSGVAALVLSANSGLTYQEVADILESTAQKVGGYSYGTEPGRSNGSWNNYVGYGLVDAGASVQAAVCNHTIENTVYSSDITISNCINVEMEDVAVTDGAVLTIENVGSIAINGPFEAEIGTQLVLFP